jgi:hypothetical protein
MSKKKKPSFWDRFIPKDEFGSEMLQQMYISTATAFLSSAVVKLVKSGVGIEMLKYVTSKLPPTPFELPVGATITDDYSVLVLVFSNGLELHVTLTVEANEETPDVE